MKPVTYRVTEDRTRLEAVIHEQHKRAIRLAMDLGKARSAIEVALAFLHDGEVELARSVLNEEATRLTPATNRTASREED